MLFFLQAILWEAQAKVIPTRVVELPRCVRRCGICPVHQKGSFRIWVLILQTESPTHPGSNGVTEMWISGFCSSYKRLHSFFLKKIFLSWVSMYCLHAGLFTRVVQYRRGQKRVLDSLRTGVLLELELQTVLSHHVGAGIEPGSSARAVGSPNSYAIPPVPPQRLHSCTTSTWCLTARRDGV